jgi:hypothetical protein
MKKSTSTEWIDCLLFVVASAPILIGLLFGSIYFAMHMTTPLCQVKKPTTISK